MPKEQPPSADGPPLDHVPAYRGTHPIAKGAIFVWCLLGAVGLALAAPFLIIFVVLYAVWAEGLERLQQWKAAAA